MKKRSERTNPALGWTCKHDHCSYSLGRLFIGFVKHFANLAGFTLSSLLQIGSDIGVLARLGLRTQDVNTVTAADGGFWARCA